MFLFISAALLAASTSNPDADWSRVRRLEHGTEVIVTLQDGSRPGPYSDVTRLVTATDTELILAPLGPRAPVIRIPRDGVASVTLRREKTRGSPNERLRGAFFGFLLTAVGAAGGGSGPNFCTDHPHGCLPVSLLGGVAGGVAAYFGGKSEKSIELTLIYRAPPRV
jgi:hypothetical protein